MKRAETIEEVFAGRSLGQMMAEGAHEFAADLVNNVDIQAKYNSRNVSFSFTEDVPFATEVINARRVLSASQPVFAQFLGFSTQIVRGWEQGKKKPSSHARRIMRFIQLDPEYWKKRFAEDAIFLPASRTTQPIEAEAVAPKRGSKREPTKRRNTSSKSEKPVTGKSRKPRSVIKK